MTQTAATLDPYAFVRRRLKRMAPLVDLDGILADHDMHVLKIWRGGEVRGIAVMDTVSPKAQMRLYYAEEPAIACELMNLLDQWLHDRSQTDTLVLAA